MSSLTGRTIAIAVHKVHKFFIVYALKLPGKLHWQLPTKVVVTSILLFQASWIPKLVRSAPIEC